MKKLAIALLLILATLALASCGGGGSSTSGEASGGGSAEGGAAEEEGVEAEGGTGGTAATIKIEASPSGLAFEEQKVTAKAGEDTIDFTNPSSIPHNVTIEDPAGKTIGETKTIAEGPSSTTVDLKPGTYTFYCSVPGHREAGMEGTLVVK